MKSLPRGVITTMFTDIVDSTRIKSLIEGETSARRDAHFRHQIKAPHDAVVLTCVRDSSGYVVNPTGDGFCVAFVDAEEAVLCALRIQQHLQGQSIATPLGPLQIRIGLHTGVASPSGKDYIASTVDKAARVQSQAGGGQVFVSQQTQVLVSDKTRGILFESRGIFDLKGLQADQLYQAIPLPELELPAVNTQDFGSHARESILALPFPGDSAGTGRLTRRFALVGIGFVCVVGLLWAFTMRKPTANLPPNAVNTAAPVSTAQPPPASSAVLPLGSQWDGNFHFLPPIAHYDGSVAILVTKRSGETFAGLYSSEDNKYQWLVEGTVKGKKVHWDFIKTLRKAGPEDAVGKAYCDATVEGEKMQGFFRNADDPREKATLDLRLTK